MDKFEGWNNKEVINYIFMVASNDEVKRFFGLISEKITSEELINFINSIE